MQHPARPFVVFVAIDELPLAIDEGHRRLPSLLATLTGERTVLVFCSSRTRAEVEGFRQSVGVFHPFVCEDGAAVFVPRGYFASGLEKARAVDGYEAIEFGLQHRAIVERVGRTADRLGLGIRGFADMSIEQVARETGLSLLEARLAKAREYSEPFRLLCANPVAEVRMIAALEHAGIRCMPQRGFLQAASSAGPAPALVALTRLYRKRLGAVQTAWAGRGRQAVDIALGDLRPSADVGPAETISWMEEIVDRIRAVRGRLPVVVPSQLTADPLSVSPR